jgi:hypothetical protein
MGKRYIVHPPRTRGLEEGVKRTCKPQKAPFCREGLIYKKALPMEQPLVQRRDIS